MKLASILGVVALAGCPLPAREPPPPTAKPAERTPPHNAAFDHSADDRDRFIQCSTRGFAPAGPPKEVQLAELAPIELELASKTCYVVVVRLGPAVQLTSRAQAGLEFVFRRQGQIGDVIGGPGVWGPGAVASRGCVERAGTESLAIEASWGSALDRSHVFDVGTGTATVQLYARQLDDAQHARCKHELDVCLADWRAGETREECEGRYEGCVASNGLPSASACRR